MLETIPLDRISGSRKEHDRVVAAACQECTVGCGLSVYMKDDRIVDIQGDPSHPINRGRLCANGIAFVQSLGSPDRITLPATRNRLSGPFESLDNWEKGIDLLAERLRRVREQHGAESLVIGCDPEAGLDFTLGARRFARLWGTPHVYHPLKEPTDAALPAEHRHRSLESGAWSQSRTLVLIEADMAATHPVAFARVLAARRTGARVIAVDSRFTATLAKADIALRIKPDRGNDLGLALMKMLLGDGAIDLAAAEANFKDFKAWKDSYEALAMAPLEAAVGLSSESLRTLGRAFCRRGPAVLITGKRLAFSRHYGIWRTMARVMGWQAVPGGGWYPLESGAPRLDPAIGLDDSAPELPCPESIAFPYQRNRLWPEALDPIPVKALIGSGDCLNDFLSPLGKRMSDVDLSVFFGSFPNRTRQAAHMVFPATAWPERDGLCFTDDGTPRWSPRIVKPNDACRTGLGFWMRLAQRLGWEDHFPWKKADGSADLNAFYQWLFKNNSETAHLEMDLIVHGDAPVSWQEGAPAPADPDAPLLRAPDAVDGPPPTGDPSAYPLDFHATRGMPRSGDAGRWRPWIRELAEETEIRIHPRVARTLGIENGDALFVASEHDVMEGTAAVSRMVPPGLVWSARRMPADRVLVYGKGQAPEDARDRLKAMEL